jgi:hypothetical protein
VAYTYNLIQARTSSAGNPIVVSIACVKLDSVLVVTIKGVGGTNRAGGALTWGSYTLTQANSTQKAATNPEASAELWYLLNPIPATSTLTIPNTAAITCLYTVVSGRVTAGGKATFLGANGGNSTSTNPTPGAIAMGDTGMLFAITAGGWLSWNPTPQAGTVIANTDDGSDGGGEQYKIQTTAATVTMDWTFGTSDDWGAVAAAFGEQPALATQSYLSVKVGDGISASERIR